MQNTKRRGWVLTAVAIVVAAVAGLLLLNYLGTLESAIGDLVPVIVAAEPIPARTLISADLVEEQLIPRKFVHDSYFFSVQDLVVGYAAVVDIDQGQVIQRNMVDANAGLEPGYRAVSLAADQVASVGGNVRPGNRVDVLASFGDEEQAKSIVLFEDVQVLAVNSLLPSVGIDTPVDISANRFLPTGELIKDAVVTLALKPEEALQLTYMANFGKEVRLIIRRLDEPESRPVAPVTQDDFVD